MTQEQIKASELISKFVKLGFTLDISKQCALIAVDEILKLFYRLTDEYKYWEEVKQEILKLI